MEISLLFNTIILFSLSFVISSICIPLIIKVAKKNALYSSRQGERHIHTGLIPRIGGVALVIGFIFSQLYLILVTPLNPSVYIEYYFLIFSFIILFILGLLDDIVDVKSYLKFFVQILVSIILVWKADVRIDSFHGIWGINYLPDIVSYIFSILVLVFFINAYNLIDGLDGLSCSIGLYSLTCFLVIFLFNQVYLESMLLISIMGSLFGFFFYNKFPAKIFMGDSGTLSIGLLIAYFSIKVSMLPLDYNGVCNPVFAMVVLSYPVIDTLRVFFRRIISGVSPFVADRNHIHHILFDLGYGHTKSTILIIFFSVIITFITYFLRLQHTLSFFISVVLILLISQLPLYLLNRKK
ncbi:MraY family glycosyltransferase [Candidatus Marinimicrobia bacterium]|nr:MraY family glycosyltransferase [Candidatus Neomarinimicrobiota bacterium]